MKVSIEAIRQRLEAAFAPVSLEIIDDSQKHAGHAGRTGAAPGDVTHVRVKIGAPALSGLSRVAAHRAVNAALAADFAAGLHALQIEIVK